ncbi:uncharacterized protein F5147DRAFT_576678, partial [Suillus discolor]
AGYGALFHESSCKIFNDKKKLLGEILVNKGLYSVKGSKRPYTRAAAVKEVLTMWEVHARLGHMAPSTITQMIHDGVITGINLDVAKKTMDSCESCKYAKAMHKPIRKVQDPPRHENFGNKVHSNLWGPSPV